MPEELAKRYFQLLGHPKRILDLGCGGGELGRYRPDSVMEIIGVDYDSRALERARAYEETLQVDLNELYLPFDDASFDGVLAKDILEHVIDPLALAREALRVLKPGYVLIASVPMAKPTVVWNDYTHVRGFTKHAGRTMLDDAGFRVEAVWRMGGVPLSNRLKFMPLVPFLLRFPVMSHMWARSWEFQARKPPE